VILILFVWAICLSSKKNRSYLFYGLFLFVLAILPYAAAARFGGGGFESRHLLLVGIPISILIVSVYKIVCERWPFLSGTMNVFMALLIVCFSLILAKNYLDWQCYAINDKAVESQLAPNSAAKMYSIFFIDDRSFPTRKKAFSEWASMFRMIWGDTRWVGFEIDDKAEINEDFKYYRDNNFEKCDIKGKRAALLITGPANSKRSGLIKKYADVLKYYFYMLTDKNKFSEFLHNDIVKVKLIPQ